MLVGDCHSICVGLIDLNRFLILFKKGISFSNVIEQGLNLRKRVMDDLLGAVNYGGDCSCNCRQFCPWHLMVATIA